MRDIDINYFAHKRDKSAWKPVQIPHKYQAHYQDWIDSLGSPPWPEGRSSKFEFLLKTTGLRYANKIDAKVTLNIRLFLNVVEKDRLVDYTLGEDSFYIARCTTKYLEGPGVFSHDKPFIATLKIENVKDASHGYKLPEKYAHRKELYAVAHVPGGNTLIRVLIDPRRTFDQSEGIIIAFGCLTNPITCTTKVYNQYIPPKYKSLLDEVGASDIRLGKPVTRPKEPKEPKTGIKRQMPQIVAPLNAPPKAPFNPSPQKDNALYLSDNEFEQRLIEVLKRPIN